MPRAADRSRRDGGDAWRHGAKYYPVPLTASLAGIQWAIMELRQAVRGREGRGYYDPRPGGNRTPNPEPCRRQGEGSGVR